MSAHPFLKNILGTPLLVQPPLPRNKLRKPPRSNAHREAPPQREKHVRFARFTYTHERFDLDTMQWVNYGKWPTFRPSQFRAGELIPHYAAEDEDG